MERVFYLFESRRIDATDDVLVTKVVVTIFDEQGQTLEQGEAALINDAWWEYATAAPAEANILVWRVFFCAKGKIY